MKVSEVTENELAKYMRIELDEDPEEITAVLKPIISAAKSYIKSYTGQEQEFIDSKEDFVIVLYVLACEMYENRTFTVEKEKLNPLIKSILDMHCINLL